jgi:PhnB protein
MAKVAKPVPDGYHTITASLTLDDAARTIEWYTKALGAEEVHRSVGPDGKIMHAELKIGDSRFMMNDVMEGVKGPKAFGGSPASLYLYVNDADALFKRAVGEGAEIRVPLDDQFWGDRGGAVGDPEGYTWWIASRVEELTPAEMQQRAAEFFKQMTEAAQT